MDVRKRDPWRAGDIAYLSDSEYFYLREWDALIRTGTLDEGTTGHPCIILRTMPDNRFVITTVSAFGSSVHNRNPVAPWKRGLHGQAHLYRSFEGSELSRYNVKPLRLVPGQQWHKPKASWVKITNVYEVPGSVLREYKPECGYRRRMDRDSLVDLRRDIAKNSFKYDARWEFEATSSPIKRQSSPPPTTGQRQAMPEAPVAPSPQWRRFTDITNRPRARAPRWLDSASTPKLQSRPITNPAPSMQATAYTPRSVTSWADIVAQPPRRPTPSVGVPHRAPRCLKVERPQWVKDVA
ncbi:hypothetical protein GE09DRAFT_345034 [Coniochaeta sp. 2T2.1]|nr:hypothetical protein GE09DRAFT_345034 [Coniochaeta sp. 2T2.1]